MGHRMRGHRRQIVQSPGTVIEAGNAHINGAIAPGEGRRNLSAVLHRLPGKLEQQALLRIHPGRLSRRNAEKGCIELVDARQHAGRKGNAPTRFRSAGMLKLVDRPATCWNTTDQIATVPERRPKLVIGSEVTGKAESHADDGNGFRR